MTQRHHLAALILVVVFACAPRLAQACSYATPGWFEIDESEIPYDQEPPGQVAEVSVWVERGTGPQSGCSDEPSECDSVGFVNVTLEPPEDDRTPEDKMGYLFELVDGQPPAGFSFPQVPVRPIWSEYYDALFPFDWQDGAQQEQESFSFRFTVRAVDLAGNMGPASEPVLASDSGIGGCATTGSSIRSLWPVLLVLLSFCLVCRRRR